MRLDTNMISANNIIYGKTVNESDISMLDLESEVSALTDIEITTSLEENLFVTSTQIPREGDEDKIEEEGQMCPICANEMDTNSVECDKCKKWACWNCHNLDENKIKAVQESEVIDGLFWLCKRCIGQVRNWIEGEQEKKEEDKDEYEALKSVNIELKNECIDHCERYENCLKIIKISEKELNEVKENAKDVSKIKDFEIKKLQREASKYKTELENEIMEKMDGKRTINNLNEMVEQLKEANRELISEVYRVKDKKTVGESNNGNQANIQQQRDIITPEPPHTKVTRVRQWENVGASKEIEAGKEIDREEEKDVSGNKENKQQRRDTQEMGVRQKEKAGIGKKNQLESASETGMYRDETEEDDASNETKSKQRRNTVCKYYIKGYCKNKYCWFAHKDCWYYTNKERCPYYGQCRFRCYKMVSEYNYNPRNNNNNREIENENNKWVHGDRGGIYKNNQQYEDYQGRSGYSKGSKSNRWKSNNINNQTRQYSKRSDMEESRGGNEHGTDNLEVMKRLNFLEQTLEQKINRIERALEEKMTYQQENFNIRYPGCPSQIGGDQGQGEMLRQKNREQQWNAHIQPLQDRPREMRNTHTLEMERQQIQYKPQENVIMKL